MINIKDLFSPLAIHNNYYKKYFSEISAKSLFFTSKHGKMHFYNLNPKHRSEKILLIHGIGSSSNTWKRIILPLSDVYNVYSIDLIGHGLSTSNKEFLNFREHVQSIEEFVDVIIKDKFTLLGHSFGGWLSLSYMLENQWNVKHLILLNTSGIYELRNKSMFLEQNIVNKLDLIKLWKLMWNRIPLTHYFFLNNALKRLNNPFIVNLFKSISEEDYIDQYTLQAIFSPVTVIWGEKDKLLPSSIITTLADNINKCHVFNLKNSAHFPHLQEPDEVIEIVNNLIPN